MLCHEKQDSADDGEASRTSVKCSYTDGLTISLMNHPQEWMEDQRLMQLRSSVRYVGFHLSRFPFKADFEISTSLCYGLELG